MTHLTPVPNTARFALSGDVLCMACKTEVGLESAGWQGFWGYWFSAGVPVARSH
jgi:hypothetical protein